MAKILTIGNKDYTIEYTIEASLYNEGVEIVTQFLVNSLDSASKNDLKEMISSMCSIPQMTLTLLYGGLLEHHSDEIRSVADAKALAKQYMIEHKEDGTGNFYDLLDFIMGVMEDDGFFKQIGLTQMIESMTEVQLPVAPQDHKKKTKATNK